MTPEQFRELALSLPEASETGDDKRRDFIVEGKNFATLFGEDGWALMTLTPKVQNDLVGAEPQVFEVCKGAWGRSGATVARLLKASEDSVLRGLMAAWHKQAPDSLK